MKRKPKNYWTYERCYIESLKYNRKIDFSKNSATAYKAALKNNWLDSICAHMPIIRKPIEYWTKENCKKEALKYKNIKDFQNKSPNVYKISCKNGWMEDITPHMKRRAIWTYEKCKLEALKFNSLSIFRKESSTCYSKINKKGWSELLCSHMERSCNKNGYLTKELCKEEASKYNIKKDFRKNCEDVYNFICKNNWLEELCGHQIEYKKPNGYWTKELCGEEAKKYKILDDFRKNSSSAYSISVKNKWIEDICINYEEQGTYYKRFIYAYEFPDNHVYVGLTYNIAKRKNQHIKTGTVFEYSEETNSIPAFKQLTRNPVSVEEAKLLEESYLQEYIKDGWAGLNKAKTGGLGGGKSKWTFDKIYKEALKYKDRSSFYKDFSWAYSVAIRRGWIEEITKHMAYKQKPAYYWNYENCRIEALKYTSKKEFNKTCTSAYQSAKRNGWLEDLCDHMKIKQELKEILKIK